jgi:hypothetical protein
MLVAAVGIGAAAQIAYAAVAGVTTTRGGAIAAVAVARGADATHSSSTTFVGVPGARLTMRGKGLLIIRFSAESECTGGTSGNWCSLEILVDGAQAKPASGSDFAFDTVDGGSWEGNAMERSIKVGAGLHTIQLMEVNTSGATDFRLDDWSFSVERAIA